MAEDRSAPAFQILELPCPGVAGPHENKDAAPRPARTLQERLNGIASQIGIDGERIRVPNGMRDALDQGAAEGRVGISLGRAGDVVALAVENGDKTALPGMAQDALQGKQPRRPAQLKERGLRLDHGHEGTDQVDDPQAELLEGPGHTGQGAVRVAAAQLQGQGFPARVETHAQGVSPGPASSDEAVGEVGHAGWGRRAHCSRRKQLAPAMATLPTGGRVASQEAAGRLLLAQALRDCHEGGKIFAFLAVILDCISDAARAFYQQWDFQELPGHRYRLFLSARQLERMMSQP